MLPAREGVVEAAGLHPSRPHEIIDRRLPIAVLPERLHRALKHLVRVKLARARHGGKHTRTPVQELLREAELRGPGC